MCWCGCERVYLWVCMYVILIIYAIVGGFSSWSLYTTIFLYIIFLPVVCYHRDSGFLQLFLILDLKYRGKNGEHTCLLRYVCQKFDFRWVFFFFYLLSMRHLRGLGVVWRARKVERKVINLKYILSECKNKMGILLSLSSQAEVLVEVSVFDSRFFIFRFFFSFLSTNIYLFIVYLY